MRAAGLRLGLSWISIWLFMFVEHQQLLECNSFDSIHIADQWYLFVNCLQLQMESSIKETTNIAVLRSGMPPIKSQTYRKSSNLLTATKAGWFVRSLVRSFIAVNPKDLILEILTERRTDWLTDVSLWIHVDCLHIMKNKIRSGNKEVFERWVL